MKKKRLKLMVIFLLCFLQIELMAKNETDNLQATLDGKISIYPNPVQGQSTLSFETKLDGFTHISAYSIDGKMIISYGEYLKAGNNSFLLSLPQGFFILNINGIGFSQSIKVMSQSKCEIKPEIAFVETKNISAVISNNSTIMRVVANATAPVLDNPIVVAASGPVYFVIRSNVSSDGGASVTACGICWSTFPNPSISNNVYVSGKGTGMFFGQASNLTASTIYYIKSFATNSVGTSYSNEISVKTTSGSEMGYPVLSTSNVTASTTHANTGGIISSQGEASVTARGICWNTSPDPTIANYTTACGSGLGIFSTSATNLSQGTTYYLRAYATNLAGTAYGNEICFTTTEVKIGDAFQGGIVAYFYKENDDGYISTMYTGLLASPSDMGTTVWYNNATYIATGQTQTGLGDAGFSNTAHISGIQGTGNYAANLCLYSSLPQNGFPWYLPSRDELNIFYTNRIAIGGFSTSEYWSSSESKISSAYYALCQNFLGGLQGADLKSKNYSVRAARKFAIAPSCPIVKTVAINAITSEGVTCTRNILSNGGSNVTASGICWSTSSYPPPYPYPRTNENIISDGSGTGVFTSTLTNLVYGLTYYVRAFATNSKGTTYADQLVFTYLYPIVVTTPVTCSDNMIITGGNVTNDAGQTILDRGVCWSFSNATPLDFWIKVSSGSGTGSYITTFNAQNTAIYIRAYITTILGTSYGNTDINNNCIITGSH